MSGVVWRGAGYLVRSLFWTRKWFRISRERLPAPPADPADGGFTVLRSALALGLIVLAYSLYPRHQVQSLAAVAAGFASGFSVDAWVSTAALVAVAYLLLGWTLRVSWRPLLRPVLHVLHPMVLALAAFAVVYPLEMSFFHQLRALNPSHPAPRAAEHLAWTMALWFIAGWFMAWPFFGFVYSAYRVSRYHLFGRGLHPALAPLVELALAARALSLALAGQAQILNLPPIPGRLVAAAPALLATAYFSRRPSGLSAPCCTSRAAACTASSAGWAGRWATGGGRCVPGCARCGTSAGPRPAASGWGCWRWPWARWCPPSCRLSCRELSAPGGTMEPGRPSKIRGKGQAVVRVCRSVTSGWRRPSGKRGCDAADPCA